MPMIGVHLKELRARRKLTVRDLASRAGVSHATISLIERDMCSPSVDTLAAMLDALGATLVDFFDNVRQSMTSSPFYSSEDLVEIGDIGSISYRLLGMNQPDRRLLMLKETYDVGADTGTPFSHKAQEAGFVLRGEIEVTIGEQTKVLHVGDGYYFDSQVPHRFRNVGTTPAEIISSVTPPTY